MPAIALTDKFCDRAKPGEHFDAHARGLALLVGKKTKTWQLHYTQDGKRRRRGLGHYPKISLADARRLVVEGKEELATTGALPSSTTFSAVVEDFVTHYCKPRQRTWDQTARILRVNCAAWKDREMGDIVPREVYTLLEGFCAADMPSKAAVTQRWLKTFWKWAYRRGSAPTNIMDRVDVEIEERERDRVYSAEEIKATWLAAEHLAGDAEAFFKLLILLAPRKTALAAVEAEDIKDGVWETPHEFTKSRKKAKKRVYLCPLPPLAQEIISALPSSGRLFPGLVLHNNQNGRQSFHGNELKAELIALGAPADMTFHGWRHTIATWLEDRGHSEWERGLVLNHAGSGSVTADYSHGYPLELKRKLMEAWAAHVESIVR